jgi:hypothetical protein
MWSTASGRHEANRDSTRLGPDRMRINAALNLIMSTTDQLITHRRLPDGQFILTLRRPFGTCDFGRPECANIGVVGTC